MKDPWRVIQHFDLKSENEKKHTVENQLKLVYTYLIIKTLVRGQRQAWHLLQSTRHSWSRYLHAVSEEGRAWAADVKHLQRLVEHSTAALNQEKQNLLLIIGVT